MLNLLEAIRQGIGSDEERFSKRYRALIRREAELGSRLFGPIPEGRRREFFCLEESTWVWHEEWLDAHQKHHAITTRYNVHPNGIVKVQDGRPYQYVSFEEGKRLCQAAQMYKDLTHVQLYA